MINLFVPTYIPKTQLRSLEMLKCYENNKNLGIFKINMISEDYYDDEDVIKVDKRPTYNEVFFIINERTKPDDINIICNSDIFFDRSILEAQNILSNECYCLTRYDFLSDKPIILPTNGDSQDTWIFRGKIKEIESDFYFGKLGCDNRIAFELNKAGYQLSNPSLSIRSFHLHSSEERSYNKEDRLYGPYKFVQPSYLKTDFRQNDDYDWSKYSRGHDLELQAMVNQGYSLLINDFEIDDNLELIFNNNLHSQWKEIYHQVFKLNPESAYECGCGTGQHLINIRKTNNKVKLGGCDYSEEQLNLGCRRFNLDSYDFLDNLGVCDFSIPGMYSKIPTHEFVYAHAVIMHLSINNRINFLENMKRLSSKYIMLIDSKSVEYDDIIDEVLPLSQYRRLTDFKYIDSNLCTLLEKI